MIFVFGSNLNGYHGLGAAKYARLNHGAQMGVFFGPTGNAFAIPTKDRTIRHTLPLATIKVYIDEFIKYAEEHPELKFQVTRIGCGLAGIPDRYMAVMFLKAPINCLFDTLWEPWLKGTTEYWGTY